jgi:prepilin-type N-terminal cleavage/methylation domain-containing protein
MKLLRVGTPPVAGSAAFTLIEMLVVIGIIGLLAALIVGGTHYASSKSKESNVRAELHQLIAAIEAYHARFNQYPPDNVVSRAPLIVNPVTNSLYYELTGVIVEDDPRKAGGTFRSPNRSQRFASALTQRYFGVDGIQNADPDPKQVKNFLPQLKTAQSRAINSLPGDQPQTELQVLVVPVPWPLTRADQPTRIRGLNPWRYVSTQPTNNPATYDLWAEYLDGKDLKIIGNWSK